MRLVVGRVWAQAADLAPEERVWLDEYLSVEVRSFRRYARPADDRFRMLGLVDDRFAAGLAGLVARAAAAAGWVCVVVDERGAPDAPPESVPDAPGEAPLEWLRWYQLEAVRAAVHAERGLIAAPTGAGKTEIMIGLTRVLPVEWLLVVHRTDLVDQAARRYTARTGERAGRFSGGRWTRGTGNLTVSTFQSIYAAMRRSGGDDVRELRQRVNGLLVDEVHAQPADSFYAVSMGLQHAYYRFGVSGTPLDRSPKDSLRTLGAIGSLVYRVPMRALIDEGVLARPRIHMIPCRQEGTTTEDWATVYRQFIVQSEARQALVADMAERATRPCLVFVDHREQGDDLVARLRARGLYSEFVYGVHSVEQRRRMVQALVDSRIDVLVCSVIFQEGVDIPQLASVVNASGKASVVGVLQRMGRGMRTAAGKVDFEVWDVQDQGQRWLADHAARRLRAYRRDGREVVLGWPAPDAAPGAPREG